MENDFVKDSKKFGFGCMRLPMQGENIDFEECSRMVDAFGYCVWTRVQETIEFMKRMEYHKIGIAICVGLIQETRELTKILRSHGFEMYGIGCKAGAVAKTGL